MQNAAGEQKSREGGGGCELCNKESDSVTRGHICLNSSLRYLMNVKVAVSSLEVK